MFKTFKTLTAQERDAKAEQLKELYRAAVLAENETFLQQRKTNSAADKEAYIKAAERLEAVKEVFTILELDYNGEEA